MHLQTKLKLSTDYRKDDALVKKFRNYTVLVLFFFLIISAIVFEPNEYFVVDVLDHIATECLVVIMAISIINWGFRNQLPNGINMLLVICGIVIFIDMVIIGTARFIVSGEFFALLLPICLPICFMVVTHFYAKEKGCKKSEKSLIYIFSFLLLILSIYLEVIAFL